MTSLRFEGVSKRLWKLGLLLFAMVGFAVVAITFLPVVPWTTKAFAADPHRPSGDVLVVLAHSVEVLPVRVVLDQGSYWLSEYVATAYRQGRFRQIIITGGENIGTPVAALMADHMQLKGVPAQAIEVEISSRDMREQAEAVGSLLGQQNGQVLLLASDYQMFRAVRVFTKAGIPVKPFPVDDAALRSKRVFQRWPVFVDLVREAAQIADYWRRGLL